MPTKGLGDNLSPNEHLHLLIELMKPIGMETARRWVAALMIVPEDQREALVDAIEAQIVAEFGDS